MLTDIEIANQAKPFKISRIAAKLNLTAEDIEPYGKYKAKLSRAKTAELASRTMTARPIAASARLSETQAAPVPNGSHPLRTPASRGALILVTALTPTPAGEGKSTVSIGLADALQRLKKRVALSLREPSLGPCFGIKGGAAGGGRSQIVPMDEINLNFTGDIHAITAANNLLAAMIDNHIKFGNGLGIAKVFFKRCVDLNDRALREVRIGLGGKANGIPRTDGFNISVASEIMAILCLSEDLADLKSRLNQIVIGETSDGTPIYARDLNAAGAMAAILKDAVLPNLVQTLEHTPAFVHGGPFANIAHGCNSVLATQMALTYGDYVITEAGFGADLGAEKFFNIKCRKAGLSPKLTVIVATAQSLKLHGGVPEAQIKEPNKEGLIRGFANLDKHIENMKNFGQQVIVTFNRFASDTDEEIALVAEHCKEKGVGFAVNTVFADGGKGAVELARLVAETIEKNTSKPLKFTYEESDSIRKKVRKIAEGIYGASSIVYTTLAEKKLKEIEKLGIAHFPVCIAKTQYSFSSDPKAYGVAKDFELKVRDIIINNGAEMIVVVMGEIMRMPGLPKEPQARHIDIVNGLIEGLS